MKPIIQNKTINVFVLDFISYMLLLWSHILWFLLSVYMFCIIEFNIIRLLVNYMLIILFFVNHDMLLKIASLTKHLATYLAYIWFITSVMSLFSIYAVSLNIPLSIKQNSYYLTKLKIAKSNEKSHYPRECSSAYPPPPKIC